MTQYLKYDASGCEDKKSTRAFLQLAVSISDAFSVVYFKYRNEDKVRKSAARLSKLLSPYRVDARETTSWPGTVLLSNSMGHSYNLVTYSCCKEVLPILEKVKTLWDWDFPKYPMDLCFYINGYAWCITTAHEHQLTIYLPEDGSLSSEDLRKAGLILDFEGRKEKADLYYNEYAKKRSDVERDEGFMKYYVEGFKDKEASARFIRAIMGFCDEMSLIYYRNRKTGKASRKMLKFRKELMPYRTCAKRVTSWPGTPSFDSENYEFSISIYSIQDAVFWYICDILEKVKNCKFRLNGTSFPLSAA